jgi:WD40 repeat protein
VKGNAAALLPNDWGVLVGCSDGQLRVLDAASAEFKADITESRTSDAMGPVIGSHDCAVGSIAVSPDGRRAVLGDANGRISIWDLSAFARG